MRTFSISVFIMILLAISALPAASVELPKAADVGEYFVPFTGPTLEGDTFKLADHYNTGKYILVNFWASW